MRRVLRTTGKNTFLMRECAVKHSISIEISSQNENFQFSRKISKISDFKVKKTNLYLVIKCSVEKKLYTVVVFLIIFYRVCLIIFYRTSHCESVGFRTDNAMYKANAKKHICATKALTDSKLRRGGFSINEEHNLSNLSPKD